jgi:hypothetical protein
VQTSSRPKQPYKVFMQENGLNFGILIRRFRKESYKDKKNKQIYP